MALPVPICPARIKTPVGEVLCTHCERDGACPEELAARIGRRERKYYYFSLTDGKPKRRELKRLAKSQTEN